MKIGFVQDTIDFIRGKKSLNKFKELEKQFKYLKYENEKFNRGFEINWSDRYLCLNDSTENTGFDAHYVYHTAWAIRKVLEINPKKHIDISSSLHFCSNLSALIPVEFYDYRPANLSLSNLECKKADLTNLPFADESIDSLSCMHVIEHIGLGRYGDELNANGDIKAINEIKRVIKEDGYLIFVVPVGKPKIQFNAHRIYAYEQIIKYFSDFKLKEFSLIPDNAIDSGMVLNADKALASTQDYACGCFVFKKGC